MVSLAGVSPICYHLSMSGPQEKGEFTSKNIFHSPLNNSIFPLHISVYYGRKELLALVNEIAKVIFFDGEVMSAEEKMVRVKSILIDSLTENTDSPAPTFSRDLKS